jgi:hypothetical protein
MASIPATQRSTSLAGVAEVVERDGRVGVRVRGPQLDVARGWTGDAWDEDRVHELVRHTRLVVWAAQMQ